MVDPKIFMVRVSCGGGEAPGFQATVRAMDQEHSCTFLCSDALARFFAGVAAPAAAPRPVTAPVPCRSAGGAPK